MPCCSNNLETSGWDRECYLRWVNGLRFSGSCVFINKMGVLIYTEKQFCVSVLLRGKFSIKCTYDEFELNERDAKACCMEDKCSGFRSRDSRQSSMKTPSISISAHNCPLSLPVCFVH